MGRKKIYHDDLFWQCAAFAKSPAINSVTFGIGGYVDIDGVFEATGTNLFACDSKDDSHGIDLTPWCDQFVAGIEKYGWPRDPIAALNFCSMHRKKHSMHSQPIASLKTLRQIFATNVSVAERMNGRSFT